MSDNIRTALYDADYSCTLASRASPTRRRCSPAWSASTARAGDIVVKDEFLPADIAPGDLLAVPGTGAYCRVDGHQLQPRPAAAGGRGARRAGAAASSAARRSRTCSASTSTERSAGGPAWHRDRRGMTSGWRNTGVSRWTPGRMRACPAPSGGGASVARATAATAGRPARAAASSGTPGGPAADRAGRRPGRAGRRAARARRHRRRAGIDAPRDVDVDRARCSPPTPTGWSPGDVDVVVEVIGGIEPARALILRALEHGAAVVTANKALLAEDGPTLFEAADDGTASTSTTRPRSPAPSRCCARCASRWPATTCAACSASSTAPPTTSSTRWTPRAPGFAEALERGPGAGLRRGRPDRRRRGLRRRRQGRDPGLAGLPHPRHRGNDVHREGITEVTAADVAVGTRDGLRRQAARHLRAHRPRWAGRRRQRPGAPGDDPADPPAGRRPRGVQRGLRRGRGRRPADVLRPRRGRRPDRLRRPRRPGHGGPQPARRRPRAGGVDLRRPADPADGRGDHPLPHRLDVDDRPGVLAQVATAFAEHDVSIETVRQQLPRPTRTSPAATVAPASSWSPTPPPTRPCRPPSTPCAALPTVRDVTSVMRVEGE